MRLISPCLARMPASASRRSTLASCSRCLLPACRSSSITFSAPPTLTLASAALTASERGASATRAASSSTRTASCAPLRDSCRASSSASLPGSSNAIASPRASASGISAVSVSSCFAAFSSLVSSFAIFSCTFFSFCLENFRSSRYLMSLRSNSLNSWSVRVSSAWMVSCSCVHVVYKVSFSSRPLLYSTYFSFSCASLASSSLLVTPILAKFPSILCKKIWCSVPCHRSSCCSFCM
mmetsp:Transcript_25247/g.42306  ORF Transcript_25247/g.42306 Transcript_25247/m.42306 type:complete len:237 (-) Transcript_25247:801-1511(-)